jgi:hypothetical protein
MVGGFVCQSSDSIGKQYSLYGTRARFFILKKIEKYFERPFLVDRVEYRAYS